MSLTMFGSVIKINPIGVVVLLGTAFFFVYMYVESYTLQSADTISLKRLLVVSIEAAERGGKEVLNARTNAHFEVKSKGKTQEGAENPLTTGDVMSNRAMLQILLSEYPRLKVISEEKEISKVKPASRISSLSTSRVDSIVTEDVRVPFDDVTVWIDPLDATQEYTEGLLEYVTTMVCVAVKGEPIIGVIHQPSINRTVWAQSGQGVSSNLKISSKPEGEMTIIVSRSHAGKVQDLAKRAFGKEVVVKPAGGAGFKVLEVISGNASAYIHVTLIKKWDICAGNAILNAIGGKMSTLTGKPIMYGPEDGSESTGGLLATKDNHQLLLTKLSQAAL